MFPTIAVFQKLFGNLKRNSSGAKSLGGCPQINNGVFMGIVFKIMKTSFFSATMGKSRLVDWFG